MMDFAVIKTGGKQYIAEPGKKLKIEKLDAKEGERVIFDTVLLTTKNGTVTVGTPTVTGAKVEAEVLRHGRAKKVIIFKYKNKTRRRTKKGHRQPYTEVVIRG